MRSLPPQTKNPRYSPVRCLLHLAIKLPALSIIIHEISLQLHVISNLVNFHVLEQFLLKYIRPCFFRYYLQDTIGLFESVESPQIKTLSYSVKPVLSGTVLSGHPVASIERSVAKVPENYFS